MLRPSSKKVLAPGVLATLSIPNWVNFYSRSAWCLNFKGLHTITLRVVQWCHDLPLNSLPFRFRSVGTQRMKQSELPYLYGAHKEKNPLGFAEKIKLESLAKDNMPRSSFKLIRIVSYSFECLLKRAPFCFQGGHISLFRYGGQTIWICKSSSLFFFVC